MEGLTDRRSFDPRPQRSGLQDSREGQPSPEHTCQSKRERERESTTCFSG